MFFLPQSGAAAKRWQMVREEIGVGVVARSGQCPGHHDYFAAVLALVSCKLSRKALGVFTIAPTIPIGLVMESDCARGRLA